MRRDGVGRFLDRIANMFGQLSKSCRRREMFNSIKNVLRKSKC
jgi:hypothetical protein